MSRGRIVGQFCGAALREITHAIGMTFPSPTDVLAQRREALLKLGHGGFDDVRHPFRRLLRRGGTKVGELRFSDRPRMSERLAQRKLTISQPVHERGDARK